MRTKEDVQNEYTQLCARAGEIVFMADELSAELAKKHQELTEIGKKVALVKAEYKALAAQPPTPTTASSEANAPANETAISSETDADTNETNSQAQRPAAS